MRTDEQLAAYNPPVGRDWKACGFSSVEEFNRWAQLARERYDRSRANAPRYFLSSDGNRMLSA